jgi:cytochrome c6
MQTGGSMLDKPKRVFATRYLALVAMLALVVLIFATNARANGADDDATAQAFKSNCIVCHGADGIGTATGKSLKAPDLHSDAVQKMTKADLIVIVSDGKNNMPPFKNTLSKDQIEGLVAYVKATFGKKKS